MTSIIFPTTTFNISLPSVNLNDGEQVYFKFVLQSATTNNFTASISQGDLKISSLAPSTGYSSVNKGYLHTGSLFSNPLNTNEIIFESSITNLYGGNYIFIPTPLITGSISSSLYSQYGDVDYPFILDVFDILSIYLSDGTFLEFRILDQYIDNDNRLRLVLNQPLSQFVKNDIINSTYEKFLLSTRKKDETNVILSFRKREGKTSYGFIIPNNLDPNILKNIDTITKEIKQKLLSEQSSTD